ncbi:MAG: hypothetical protein GXO55_02305 [Chloroflexi bacterium]|nr:hypothetical protein [Chloroflexota bacterium]
MIAFVLSGGGNRGPLQVGALDVLFQKGIRPDLLVGTSAGAINAAYVAARGPDANMEELAHLWHQAKRHVVYPGNVFTIALRVLLGADSFFPGYGIRQLIRRHLPPGVRTFGDLKIPCYLTAVDLRTARLYLFGEDPTAPLEDAIVASASVPGIHPPVEYHGLQLVDGGVVAAVPAGIAMEKGATTLYVINVGYGGEPREPVHGVVNILKRVLDTFVVQSLLRDIGRAAADPHIEMHHIHIRAFDDLPFTDFHHIDEMIEAGRETTEAYLAHPTPFSVEEVLAQGEPVPGARVWEGY